ncbi:MAG: right-handed parallel beta-helix repeat-containing protein [Candidatus Zixiibacteriota bacterium]|nr:MAG: right-handed parallel beta-helix repeat-containing protein [candidate division Zixibacteria bacterium]
MRANLNTYGPLLLVVLCLSAVNAETFVVESSGESHDPAPGDGVCGTAGTLSFDCSLRAAIEEASALHGADTILVPSSTGTIRLSFGPLAITDDSTCLLGGGDYPAIDGAANPFGSPLILIESNDNAVSGLSIQRSKGSAIVVYGKRNCIGGETAEGRNIFAYNGIGLVATAAVHISGSRAEGNRVTGNFIGMTGNGTIVRPNSNGISITHGAHHNIIENNLISGNESHGVVISEEAAHNTVCGNLIGPDAGASAGPGNGQNGILIRSRAHNNLIGGERIVETNLIGHNGNHGLHISGANENTVYGNNIGLDHTGRTAAGNLGCGIVISDGAMLNQIGGTTTDHLNLVSFNHFTGIRISGVGTTDNQIHGNHIGTDLQGIRPCGNGVNSLLHGHGVAIDSGASGNLIGGTEPGEGNVTASNRSAGVCITGPGTDGNIVAGNYVGVNSRGSSSLPNGAGVIIRGGASDNVIGGTTEAARNLLSGNRSDIFPFGCGVLMSDAGTSGNKVSGNYIGLDITGTRALRNGSAGIIVAEGASHNTIGGTTEAERNVISGNGSDTFSSGLARGVHIFGHGTGFNLIIGNCIGLSAGGDSRVENIGHGVGIFAGAHSNEIGGATLEHGNLISQNAGHGIVISNSSSCYNLIRNNRMLDNDSLAVAVLDGAQDSLLPPTLTGISDGVLTGTAAPPEGQVDIYLAAPDPSNRGEGRLLIASVLADAAGDFTVDLSSLTEEDTISAIATDVKNNSSEFSVNLAIGTPTYVDPNSTAMPLTFDLSQNYPNPFNLSTTIEFTLPYSMNVKLTVFDLLGRETTTLTNRFLKAGRQHVCWDGRDGSGRTAASGVYFYRLEAGSDIRTRKMVLLK